MINSKNIIEAYLFLRSENQTIPSEALDFMKEASLEKLAKIEKAREARLSGKFEITEITPPKNNLFNKLQSQFPSSNVRVEYLSSKAPMKPTVIMAVYLHSEWFSCRVESQWFESDDALFHTAITLISNGIKAHLNKAVENANK